MATLDIKFEVFPDIDPGPDNQALAKALVREGLDMVKNRINKLGTPNDAAMLQLKLIDAMLNDETYGERQTRFAKAFELVQNSEHWKNPIDKFVTTAQVRQVGGLDTIRQAVVHFTGTTPTIKVKVGGYQISAVGYRNGPCGP
jgi:hypothetical protein